MKYKICIVEDNPLALHTIVTLLETESRYIVSATYSNAEDCLIEFEFIRPDITLMDITLPGISGIEAVIKIKANYPFAKVIMLTIHDDKAKVHEALKAGADGYLLKNHAMEKIHDTLTDLLNGGTPISVKMHEN